MAKKKKDKKASSPKKASHREPEPFHGAFQALGAIGKKTEPVDVPLVKPQRIERRREDEESRCFLQAMQGVTPLKAPSKKVTRAPDPTLRPAHPSMGEELEALAHLSDLVSGNAEMDITFSDEYIEGAVHGFSRKLMQSLKKGELPVQDHIDLHGLTKQEAKIRVREFLLHAYRQGLRCVLVVHGRGLNSENHIPVLKERLPIWLTSGPARKVVLAFSTARPYDGGTGAIYILLRKRRGLL
jgi:DNA-nicking Smr family endonuclease